MTTKDDLRDELNELTDDSGSETKFIGLVYTHPDTGILYDDHKNKVTPDDYLSCVVCPWTYAPFVVDREKAESEGWNIVSTVECGEDEHREYVEVSEWCLNPHIPEKREVVSR